MKEAEISNAAVRSVEVQTGLCNVMYDNMTVYHLLINALELTQPSLLACKVYYTYT